jgi:predicted lysophospholipase L1 biosynthesis ABC-type transport system permease subunit
MVEAPLVSFDAELAKGLGLKLGDPVTVNILGRNIEATIASMRKIDWESLAINFVMVFSPNTLEGAPHRMLTTLELPKGTQSEQEAKVVQALAERFPLVTAIRVGDIVEAAKELLGKVMTAISATAGVTLLIGAAVLAGAVAAGQERRKYLAVIYKTLGATRLRIIRAELLEFALLGLATAALALLPGRSANGRLRSRSCSRRLPPPKRFCSRSPSCSRSAGSPPGGCFRPRRRPISAPSSNVRGIGDTPASSCVFRLNPPYSWPKCLT